MMILFRVDHRDKPATDRVNLGLVELASVDHEGEYDNKYRLMVSPEVIQSLEKPGVYFRVDIRPAAKKVTFDTAPATRG